jgi:hypothetical protein
MFEGWHAKPDKLLLIKSLKNCVPTFIVYNQFGDGYAFKNAIFTAGCKDEAFASTVSVYENTTRGRRIEIEKDDIVYGVGERIAIKTIHGKEQQIELTGLFVASDLQFTIPARCLYKARKSGAACVVMPFVETTLLQLAPRFTKHEQILNIVRTVTKMMLSLYDSGVSYVDLKLNNIVVTNYAKLVFIDYGSIAANDSDEGYATYPPLSAPLGVHVECSENNLVEIIGNFALCFLYPNLEPLIRYGIPKLAESREKALASMDCDACRDLVSFCWSDCKCKTLQRVLGEIDHACVIHSF